jgi:hypothetical protein
MIRLNCFDLSTREENHDTAAGWRALRSGDPAGACENLWRSLRRCPYDIRQPVMLGAALLARLPFIPRAAVLQAVRK